jgi:hypothetical protein
MHTPVPTQVPTTTIVVAGISVAMTAAADTTKFRHVD